MDMTASIAPKTDQINNEDLIAGPITVTINRVTVGPPEQPFNFHMAETPGRAYRPSKSMRRVMVAAWGTDAAAFVGRSLTLYRNPATKFGSELTGGIEISHLSHIERPVTVPLTAKRGVRKNFTVKPLAAPTQPTDTSGRNWLAELELAGDDIDAVASLGKAASAAHAAKEIVAAMSRKWQELKAAESGAEG